MLKTSKFSILLGKFKTEVSPSKKRSIAMKTN